MRSNNRIQSFSHVFTLLRFNIKRNVSMFSRHISHTGSSSMSITGVKTFISSKFSLITLHIVFYRHRFSINIIRSRFSLHKEVHLMCKGNRHSSQRSNRIRHDPLPTNIESSKRQFTKRSTLNSRTFNSNSSLNARFNNTRQQPLTVLILMFSR